MNTHIMGLYGQKYLSYKRSDFLFIANTSLKDTIDMFRFLVK